MFFVKQQVSLSGVSYSVLPSPVNPHICSLSQPLSTVAPGKLEGEHMYRVIPEDDSSLEVSSPRDQQSPSLTSGAPPTRKDTEKTARRKVKDTCSFI